MKLSYQGIQDKQGYAAAQVALPQYDWAKMAEKTAEKPVWVHFGAATSSAALSRDFSSAC